MILQALTAKNNVLFCGLNQSVCCHKTTVKLLPQASDDYIPYLITALQYLMSMGIYNLPRGKKKKKEEKQPVPGCSLLKPAMYKQKTEMQTQLLQQSPQGQKNKKRENKKEKKRKKDQFRCTENTRAPEVIQKLFCHLLIFYLLD